MMRPETLETLEPLLTSFKFYSVLYGEGRSRRYMEQIMSCLEKGYTADEFVRHLTREYPAIPPNELRKCFKQMMEIFDQISMPSVQTYLEDAKNCSNQRKIDQKPEDSKKAKSNNQGETSKKKND